MTKVNEGKKKFVIVKNDDNRPQTKNQPAIKAKRIADEVIVDSPPLFYQDRIHSNEQPVEVKNEQVIKLVNAIRSSFLAPVIRKIDISTDMYITAWLQYKRKNHPHIGFISFTRRNQESSKWKAELHISDLNIDIFFPDKKIKNLLPRNQRFNSYDMRIVDSLDIGKIKTAVFVNMENPVITPDIFQKQLFEFIKNDKKEYKEWLRDAELEYLSVKRVYDALMKAEEIILDKQPAKKP
jgi:hypothetical protein